MKVQFPINHFKNRLITMSSYRRALTRLLALIGVSGFLDLFTASARGVTAGDVNCDKYVDATDIGKDAVKTGKITGTSEVILMKRIPLICALVSTLVFPWSIARAEFYMTIVDGEVGQTVRTVVVSPKATPARSGRALRRALRDITDASASKPYMIKIEPGVYNLRARSLRMKAYVDIEGSGEIATKITGNIDSGNDGVVRGVSNAEIRFLTVENTGGGSYAVAIYNSGLPPHN